MHIFLDDENTNKLIRIGAPNMLDKAPNRFINQFINKIDETNFVDIMREAMRSEHVKIKITVEPLERNAEK